MRERSTRVKRGHTKVDETDSSQSSLDKLGINASQLTASCFTLDAFNFFSIIHNKGKLVFLNFDSWFSGKGCVNYLHVNCYVLKLSMYLIPMAVDRLFKNAIFISDAITVCRIA